MNAYRWSAGIGLAASLWLLGGGVLGGQTATTAQPEFKTLKADFVPGEKTLFFDDFTDMGPDDPPLHFKSRGAAPELREGAGIRQLTVIANNQLVPTLAALPKNFTAEIEAKFDVPQGTARVALVFFSKDREAAAWILAVRNNGADMSLTRKLPKYEELGKKAFTMSLAKQAMLALSIQDGRIRVFVNDDKHLDANQVDLPLIDRVELQTSIIGKGPTVGYRSVRFAESAPDFGAVLNASGRYVSHGILFDTDSDRLKPASAAAIQAVAKALQTNPALQLAIEGHTDAVGAAAHNLELSKRRAEAVKNVLVSQFQIDAGRLTTTGLGSTKPIDTNDTPQGRAQNRRVEFVKRQ